MKQEPFGTDSRDICPRKENGFKNGRRLVEVARKAADREKPLVLAKVGRSEAGRRAAASHTGSLAGSDEAYETAFRQLGVIRVDDVEEMLDVAAYFSTTRVPAGRRVAIVTTSGGAGAWLSDACAARGLELPEVEEEVQAAIRPLLPPYASTANPIDITAQVVGHGGLEQSVQLVAKSQRVDAIAVVTSLAAEDYFWQFLPELQQAVAATEKAIVYYSYTTPTTRSLAALRELSIPCYPTPARAARALGWAAWYGTFLQSKHDIALLQPGTPRAARLEAQFPRCGATEREARAFLAPCAIRSPREGLARSAAEAVALFRELGGPVALKVQSPQILHKTDVGGVRLGLSTEAEVRRAYEEVLAATRTRRPDADIHGVLVQEMVTDGIELILGARMDTGLGPLVMLGVGGIYVEAFRDVTFRLAPVSLNEARAMISEIRGAALLQGARGRPPADVAALAAAIARFSEFVAGLPDGAGDIDINPLVVLPEGRRVVMVDAALANIRATGAGPCIVATDFGQPDNPAPPDGMDEFVRGLLEAGFTDAEVERMACQNPLWLAGF